VNNVLRRYGKKNTVTGEDFDELKDVTRKLYKVFTEPEVDKAADLLNGVLAEFAAPPHLSDHGGGTWHLHVDSGDHAPWAERFAASSALAIAALLAEKGRNPCGLCASPSCRKPFIDLGKGGGRSYCSPRCATRERVAAHRKRVTGLAA
jgi:predicted RNA-binding Zn ribbon-like protein